MSEKTELCCTDVTGTTIINVFHLKYEWKIVNFSLSTKTTGRYLSSPRFSPTEDANIQWSLTIFPEGYNDDDKDFVSLFVGFDPTESRTEITAKCDLCIIGKEGVKFQKNLTHHFKEDDYNFGFYRYIRKSDLLKHGKFLQNDCLTIVCKVTGQLGINTLPNRLKDKFMNFDEANKNYQQAGYVQLFKNQELSDIVLNASGKPLYAHKAIVAAHSPVFLAMFNNNMKEKLTSEVQISDVQFDVFQEVLRFIYCRTIENTELYIYDLLVVSDQYAIESLKLECEKYLSKNLTIANVIDVLAVADTYKAENLREYSIEFFLKHKIEIVGTENFKSFFKLQPHTIEEITKMIIIHNH